MKEPHIYSPFSISNLTHNLKISINFVIDNKKKRRYSNENIQHSANG